MKQIHIRLVLLTIVTIALAFLISVIVYSKEAKAQSFRGLIIDALVFNIEDVNPGDSITKSFTVTYDFQPESDGSYKEVLIKLNSSDFTQGDLPGMPKFLAKEDVPIGQRMSDWITFDRDQIILNKPNQKELVTFTITVPSYAEPGGKYSAVFLNNEEGYEVVSDLEDSNSSGFGLNASLGPLILLTVNGNVEKSLGINDIYTRNIKGKKTSFFFNPPVDIVIDFANTGNTHVIPRGTVFVHKGKKLTSEALASFELNPKGAAVLPDTNREFVFRWDPESLIKTVEKVSKENDVEVKEYKTNYDLSNVQSVKIGKYYVTVQFDYEDAQGQRIPAVMGNASFIMFPWQLLVLILIIFLSTSFYLSRRLRSQK